MTRPRLPKSMTKFLEFCGKDSVLLTWGADDVSVLKQNAACFTPDSQLPKTYNIQRYFAEAFELGNSQKSLKSAMEQLHIEEEADRTFHHALHDAYYTARVLQKLSNSQKGAGLRAAAPQARPHDDPAALPHHAHGALGRRGASAQGRFAAQPAPPASSPPR